MRFKNLLIALATFGILSGSIIYALAPYDQPNQWSIGSQTLGITLDSSGNLVPNVDDACSLGTSTYEWSNLRIDGTATIDTLVVDLTSTFTGDVTASADLRTAAFLGLSAADRIAVLTTMEGGFTPTSSFITLYATGTITLSSWTVPIITTANSEGDFLIITNTTTVAVTFTDAVTTQRLQLNTDRALGQYDTLVLVLVSTGSSATSKYWQEVSYIAN